MLTLCVTWSPVLGWLRKTWNRLWCWVEMVTTKLALSGHCIYPIVLFSVCSSQVSQVWLLMSILELSFLP